jgi:protocatechuate 4,5-dioxygenase beta chain
MATIVGGITTSHIPLIGKAISQGLQDEPYWKPFFEGYKEVHNWLNTVKPDVAVMVYNDHGLNFFLNNLPTFAVGAAPEYGVEDEGWGLPTFPAYKGYPEMSWHMIESLVRSEFDIATCQEMVVDHAVVNPMRLLWPDQEPPAIKMVPINVNTVQHPLATPNRCYNFGKAIGKAIETFEDDVKVVIIGTGGMSHQLDGERAGFINKEFDMLCMEKLVDDPEALTKYTIDEIVKLAGTQGAEIIMWLITRGALTGTVSKVHSSYHIPISNTAAGVLLLENAA